MKRLLYISVLSLFCFFAFTSCNDDENITEPGPNIEKSNVTFDAVGGSGTIVVSAKGSPTASADKDWCSVVNISGKTVNISVPTNNDLQGRTALVSIKADGQTLTVPVTQTGVILALDNESLLFPRNESTKNVIVLKNSLPYNVTSSESWLSYAIIGNTIEITASASTLVKREANLTLTCGSVVKKIHITQSLVYQDFIGSYTFDFIRSSVAISRNVTVSQKTVDRLLTVTGACPFPFDLTFSPANGTVSIYPQAIGTNGANTVQLSVWNTVSGNLTWGTDYFYLGKVDESYDGLRIVFQDGGSWAGEKINAFILWQLTSAGATAGEFPGGDSRYTYVTMTKK